MATCFVCGETVRIGRLCRTHATAVATCDDITAEQIRSSATGQPEAWLIDQWGCTHAIDGTATIGRSLDECTVSVLHPSVSVVHAQLEQTPSGWRVADRGSLNGTHVNGEQVRVAPIGSGALLRIGEVSLYFSAGHLPEVKDAGATGRTQPSKLSDVSLNATLTGSGGSCELLQRPGGGVVRKDGDTVLELARLEFGLLAILAEQRANADDPELAFIASRDLADRLEFNSSHADSENVRELVRRVRKKLAAAGVMELIDSRQRVGYRLAADVVRH